MKANSNFLDCFIDIVQKYPENIAVLQDGTSRTTYLELYNNALKVADYLKQENADTIIGISIEKSVAYITCILGCWFAKRAFVPVDGTLPRARRDFIKKDAGIRFVMDDSVFAIALKRGKIKKTDTKIPKDYLAYIIYTSGTTGNPKGVMVSHNGIVNLANNQIAAFNINNTSRFLFYLSINFDASISDISVCLLSGATLVIETVQKLQLASNIAALSCQRQITHTDIPPSLLKLLRPDDMPTLKTIVIGGEACDVKTAQTWGAHLNLVNVYGPTEATVCTSLCKCTDKWNAPLLGQELSNIKYQIFDSDLNECAIDVPGELFISGIGLAIGYVNNPGLTAMKFVHINGQRFYRTGDAVVRLKSGDIQFLGRIDRQVKIRGQLVELEEIETKINQISGIYKSCVLKRKLFFGNTEHLVAFVEGGDKKISSKKIHDYLKRHLPPYMLPAHIEFLPQLPITITGKINQKVLLSYKLKKDELKHMDEDLSLNEKKLIAVFQSVLQTENISVDDGFRELGGDSLGIIETVLQCQELGLNISPELLIKKNTPRKIAQFLNKDISSKMTVRQLVRETRFEYKSSEKRTVAKKIKNVLITGGTGFLGTALVEKLLAKTKYTLCLLVRGKNPIDKIPKKWRNNKRIKIVNGDIGEDLFGLSVMEYNELLHGIDAVYHCAATVNMILSYDDLKNINLDATKRVLDFCITAKKKTLHYASTLSVFVSTDKNTGTVYESDRLNDVQFVFGGYAQTKFAAEKYLLNVPNDVCDVYIYRFGLITGDTSGGRSAKNDFLGMFIRGASEIKTLPIDVTGEMSVDITPINYAAYAMAKISISKTPLRIFHIANRNPLFYNDFLKLLKSMRVIDDVVPYSEWSAYIKSKKTFSANESSLILGLCRLDKKEYERHRCMDLFQATNIIFDDTNTRMVIKIKCPKPTKKLIKKYIHNGVNDA